MHFEYSVFLGNAFQQFAQALSEHAKNHAQAQEQALEQAQEPALAQLSSVLPKLRPIVVQDTPEYMQMPLASQACFQVASLLNKESALVERKITAQEVSQAFQRFLAHAPLGAEEQTAAERWFNLEINDAGYINAAPTQWFEEKFFAALEEHGPRVLFSKDSFVIALDTNQLANVNLSSHPCIDWGQVQTMAVQSRNEDVANLLKSLEGAVETASSDDKLMLLALLADAEMSVESYLQGLNGRENVPWYFRKLINDATTLEKYALDEAQTEQEFIAKPLKSLSDKLLSFRENCLINLERGRPERYMGYLLQLASEFFSFYNDPRVRACLTSKVSKAKQQSRSSVTAEIDSLEPSSRRLGAVVKNLREIIGIVMEAL